MKTFFSRLYSFEMLGNTVNCVQKKNGKAFFLKPYFCLSYDLSKRGENKTSANVNIL